MNEVLGVPKKEGWRNAAVRLSLRYPSLGRYILSSSRTDWIFHCLDRSNTSACLDIGSGWGGNSFALSKFYKEVWSLEAVKHKAYKMGIKMRDNRLLWSANEIRQLKKLYQDENAQAIADKLGRSHWKLILGKADVDAALSFLFEKYSRNGVSRNSTTSVETQAVAAKRS